MGTPLARQRNVVGAGRGYTLIEVLIVVVVLGIAGAIVVPQMLSAGQLGVQAAVRMVIADIHYAQNDAVAQQAPRCVEFDPDNDSYALTDCAGQKIDVQWRTGGGEGYEVSFRNDQRFRGVRLIEAQFEEDSVLEFDSLGGPEAGGRVVLDHNGSRYEVVVTAFTGRIQVRPITGGE